MLNKFLPILLIINTSMHAYGYIQNTNNTHELLNNTTNNNMQSITNNNKRSFYIEVHNSEENIGRNEQLNNNIHDVITNAISSNETEQLNDIIDIIIKEVINTTQQFCNNNTQHSILNGIRTIDKQLDNNDINNIVLNELNNNDTITDTNHLHKRNFKNKNIGNKKHLNKKRRRAQDALSINEHNLQKLKKNRMTYKIKINKINNK
ncbi:MAG: hypothetical protein IJU54_02350 [Alphaproteobacteria bacterium]|nr:hypothetical protein [Alphaproteobacteria bacterium]